MATNTEGSLGGEDTPAQTSGSDSELDTAIAAEQRLLARVEEDYKAQLVGGSTNAVQAIHCLELQGAVAGLDPQTEDRAIDCWRQALALRNEGDVPPLQNVGIVPLFLEFQRADDVEQLRGNPYSLALASANVFKRLLGDNHPAEQIAKLHVIEQCALGRQDWETACNCLQEFIDSSLLSNSPVAVNSNKQPSPIQQKSAPIPLHTAVALRICCMAKTYLDGDVNEDNNQFCVKLTRLLFLVLQNATDVMKHQNTPTRNSRSENSSATSQFNEKKQIVVSSQSQLVRAVHKSFNIDNQGQLQELSWWYQSAIRTACKMEHPAFDMYRGAGIWRHWLNGELTLAQQFIDHSESIGKVSACGNQPVHLSCDGQKRTLLHEILSEDALSTLDREKVKAIIEVLIYKGASLDTADSDGKTVRDLLIANNLDLPSIPTANPTAEADV